MDGDNMKKGANPEQFVVQGMTGVDLTLTIAGPGSRSYAFIIDWHIRLLLALAWFVLSVLVFAGGFAALSKAAGRAMLITTLPASILYLFYHPILELLMRGQTPGKRMAGVRIVNREGGPPSVGAILIRNAFRLIDSLPVFYLIGLVATFVTEQRIRIGDMAAGTLLVMDENTSAKSLQHLSKVGAQGHLDPNTVDLIEQLLERWKSLEPAKRRAIATSLLQRIDTAPPRPLNDMSDEELRARLIALTGNGESRR